MLRTDSEPEWSGLGLDLEQELFVLFHGPHEEGLRQRVFLRLLRGPAAEHMVTLPFPEPKHPLLALHYHPDIITVQVSHGP